MKDTSKSAAKKNAKRFGIIIFLLFVSLLFTVHLAANELNKAQELKSNMEESSNKHRRLGTTVYRFDPETNLCEHFLWVRWSTITEINGYYMCDGLKGNKYCFIHHGDPNLQIFYYGGPDGDYEERELGDEESSFSFSEIKESKQESTKAQKYPTQFINRWLITHESHILFFCAS